MTAILTRLIARVTGRLPIGWLQLSHSRARMIAAISGVAFADILVFVQLGILGALNQSTIAPYDLFRADIMISSADANTLTDGSNVARSWMFQALSVPEVADATPLFLANTEWQRPDGGTSTLQTFGLSPDRPAFVAPELAPRLADLRLDGRVLLDRRTRGLSAGALDGVSRDAPYRFELNGTTVRAVGTLDVGGGFSADGTLLVSDQTFLRLFANRAPGAPNHILVTVKDGSDPAAVVERLRQILPAAAVKVAETAEAAAADLAYQTTERPTGVIFGFGVAIGIVVGLVIVYQVLSTDVADHLREYATFKAIGYPQRFFLGIVLEEAVLLALFGFLPAVAIAIGLYAALSAATGLPLAMDAARAGSVLLGTLVACALSGALATRRLASADPADLF